MRAKTGLVIRIVSVACLGAACLGTPALAAGASCDGPPALAAKVHGHPDAAAYSELGMWFGDHQNYDCAIEAFRSALKFEPDSVRLNYLIGLTLFSSGHPDNAVTALQESIRLAPDNLKAHVILGAALAQLHRDADAKAEWEVALKIDPHSPDAIDFLSKMLAAEGNYGATIASLRSAKLDESLSLRLAFAYDKAGNLDKASEVLKTALRAKPSSLALSAALETILVKQSLFQDAIRLAAKAAQLHPGNLEAERNYFRLMVINDDHATAAPLGRKLLLKAPHDFEVLYLNGITGACGGPDIRRCPQASGRGCGFGSEALQRPLQFGSGAG